MYLYATDINMTCKTKKESTEQYFTPQYMVFVLRNVLRLFTIDHFYMTLTSIIIICFKYCKVNKLGFRIIYPRYISLKTLLIFQDYDFYS